MGHLIDGDAIPGGIAIDIGLNHTFPSTGMTLSSGDIQARISFNTWVLDVATNNYTYWVNETTPWTDLTVGESNVISWIPPTDISGTVHLVLESRSDQYKGLIPILSLAKCSKCSCLSHKANANIPLNLVKAFSMPQ